MNMRAALAAAASAVPDVEVEPYFKLTTKSGTGYIRLNRTEHPNPFGGITYWDVVIVLDRDIAKSEQWIESHELPLVEAIKTVMRVTLVEPAMLAVGDGPALAGLIITGYRAQEQE